jgi:GT2 family glycosyltransferase
LVDLARHLSVGEDHSRRDRRPRRLLTHASVVVVAYRAGDALTRLLHSLAGQDGLHEVIVVDNGGGGVEIEEARGRDGVRVLDAGGNVGFAAGCNAGAAAAEGDALVFLNPDTVAAHGAVAQLVRTLDDPEIGIAMARLRLLDRPELLNSRGLEVHVSGLSWAGGYGEPAESVDEVHDVPAASGTALAVRADAFRELGGFTNELFMYQEDLLLGWKARLAGLRVVVDPAADVFHDYDYARNGAKHYLLERNRLVFTFSTYSPRLLALLAPVLLSTEVALAVHAARNGWLRDKLRAWAWMLGNGRWVLRHRRATQRLRRVPDRALAGLLTPTLSPAMIDLPRGAGAANRVVEGYWRLVRRAL